MLDPTAKPRARVAALPPPNRRANIARIRRCLLETGITEELDRIAARRKLQSRAVCQIVPRLHPPLCRRPQSSRPDDLG